MHPGADSLKRQRQTAVHLYGYAAVGESVSARYAFEGGVPCRMVPLNRVEPRINSSLEDGFILFLCNY